LRDVKADPLRWIISSPVTITGSPTFKVSVDTVTESRVRPKDGTLTNVNGT
jgi:hypothetical protein